MTTTAYSYTRWSTPEQGDGDSLRRQTEAAERYAAQHGLKLDRSLTFRDAGVSGFRGANVRTGELARFVTAVERGIVKKGSFLLVENLDRLSRQAPLEALDDLRRILRLGITVVTLTDGKRYTAESLEGGGDITDLITSLLHMYRAHSESRLKSSRVSGAWASKRTRAASNGEKLTGACPAWLKLDPQTGRFAVLEDRAKIVRRIFSMVANDGMGHHAIAKKLNEEGVKAIGRGGSWQSSYVQKILRNEAVIGVYQPHRLVIGADGTKRRVPEGEPIPDYFPVILPKSLFVKVREMRTERRTPPPGRPRKAGANGVRNVFSGLLRCGHCGGPVHFVNKGESPKGGHYLVCERARRGVGTCEYRAWNYARFEPVVLTALWKEVDWAGMLPRAKEAVQEAIEQLEDRKAALDLERATVEQRLARVIDTLQDAPKSDALLARLRELEDRKAQIAAETRDVADRLEGEREKLRTARESAKEVREAFAQFMASLNAAKKADRIEDAGRADAARSRLAVTLRNAIQEMRLYGDGRSADSVVEVNLRETKELVRLPLAVLDKLGPAVTAWTLKPLKIPARERRRPR